MNDSTGIAFADALAIIGVVAARHRVAGESLALPRTHGRVLAQHVDLPGGQVGLHAGQVLTPARVSLAASLGLASLQVSRRPTVAVFTSGDHLIEPGMPLASGQAYDSDRELLMGLLRADGLEPTGWPRLPNDPRQVEIALRDAGCAFDLILTCGAAAGTLGVLARFGQPHFGPVRMQPGLPALFGSLDQAQVLGLPGGPDPLLATYLTLGRALIEGLQGRTEPRARWHAQLTGPIDKAHGLRAFQPARIHTDPGGRLLAEPGVAVAGLSNALIVVPENSPPLVSGDVVEVIGDL